MPMHSHTLAAHTHDIPPLPVEVRASSFAATQASPGGNVLAKATIAQGGGLTPITNIYITGLADVTLAAGAAVSAQGTTGGASGPTTTAGGSAPHQNMQPFLGVNCIIALEGIFRVASDRRQARLLLSEGLRPSELPNTLSRMRRPLQSRAPHCCVARALTRCAPSR